MGLWIFIGRFPLLPSAFPLVLYLAGNSPAPDRFSFGPCFTAKYLPQKCRGLEIRGEKSLKISHYARQSVRSSTCTLINLTLPRRMTAGDRIVVPERVEIWLAQAYNLDFRLNLRFNANGAGHYRQSDPIDTTDFENPCHLVGCRSGRQDIINDQDVPIGRFG